MDSSKLLAEAGVLFEGADLKIEKIHSHLNGHEWLLVHQPRIWKEIERIVGRVDANGFKTKISMEKTMRGKLLFAPKELNRRLSVEFGKARWSESGQADFMKNRVAVETHFGKSIVYDFFAKHLAFYVRDAIDVGIEILPMRSMQKGMSSECGDYEASLYDIGGRGRGGPAVPLVLVGVAP